MANIKGVFKYIHKSEGTLSLEQIIAIPEKYKGVFNFTYSYIIERIGGK